eukprot:TRINITY_DN13066_c2_g1_i2.p1 TRINITY_DN13066_c2_g1~~TRINITY_DN13066_c2_g1_i2.p1  ORF type:complete len:118 (-),score=20.16 TRINITY_DN13066_c2_g1_i2:407-760(-)
MVGEKLVSWKSKKQVVMAKSSDEAEYWAVAHGCCELVWQRILLKEIGFTQGGPMVYHCDNTSAIKLGKTPVLHERIKNVEVDCHFIREKTDEKDMVLAYTSTVDQLADFLTKEVSRK